MPQLRYRPDHDYYDLLGIRSSASPDAIRRAYHALAKDYHPDRNPQRQAWATAQFQAINEAYNVLSDPEARRQYDHLRWPHARHEKGHRDTGHTRYQQTTHVYSDWTRTGAAPPPPAPEFSRDHLWHTIHALLRGPFGSIYVILFLICLFSPLTSLALSHWTGRIATSLTPTASEVQTDAACQDPGAIITAPAAGSTLQASTAIVGTASDPDFARYEVLLVRDGRLDDPPEAETAARVIASGKSPVMGDLLAANLPLQDLPPGFYDLVLVVEREDGTRLPDCSRAVFYAGK